MKNFRPYLWVLYPVFVLLLVLTSSTWFAGGASEILNALNSKSQKVQIELSKRNNMQTKLAILKSLNEKNELEKLKNLRLSLPTENQLWTLLSEMKSAGTISNFRNTTIEFVTANSDDLQTILEKIDSLKPLVSVKSLQFGSGKTALEVVNHWEPLPSLTK